MLVLKPIDTAQATYFRCVKHKFTDYLVALNTAFGVEAYVVSLNYDLNLGVINGNITLPLAKRGEGAKTNIRVFSATTINPDINQIFLDGGAEYNTEQWGVFLNDVYTTGGVELEIYRGNIFVTSQTNLDKYKLL